VVRLPAQVLITVTMPHASHFERVVGLHHAAQAWLLSAALHRSRGVSPVPFKQPLELSRVAEGASGGPLQNTVPGGTKVHLVEWPAFGQLATLPQGGSGVIGRFLHCCMQCPRQPAFALNSVHPPCLSHTI